jgi:hypothetical protein
VGAGVTSPVKNPASGTNEIDRKRPIVSTIWKKNSFPAELNRKNGKFPLGAFISSGVQPAKACVGQYMVEVQSGALFLLQASARADVLRSCPIFFSELSYHVPSQSNGAFSNLCNRSSDRNPRRNGRFYAAQMYASYA